MIELAPYGFHYDLSKIYQHIVRLLQYYIAFNDLQNFWMPIEDYRKLFQESYLSFRLPAENGPLDSVTPPYLNNNSLGISATVNAWRDIWKDKYYPETCKENTKILDDYLTLCEKNNVRPIMFLMPMAEYFQQRFNRKLLDEFYCIVQCALQKHSAAIFYDGWKLSNFFNSDFLDGEHLNSQGAEKFSKIFNNFIEQL